MALSTKKPEPSLSSFTIPVSVDRLALERLINDKLSGTLFDDKISEGNLLITVTKSGLISFDLGNKQLRYALPLHIGIKKEFMMGEVAAEGNIELVFHTNFRLQEDWTIRSKTEISNYDWISKPKASILGFRIPITNIAERVLNNSQKKVIDLIDNQINQSILLKTYAAQAWNLIQDPVDVSTVFPLYLRFKPRQFKVAPLQSVSNQLLLSFFMDGLLESGMQSNLIAIEKSRLVPLQVKTMEDEQLFNLKTSFALPFEDLRSSLLKLYKGEVFQAFGWNIMTDDFQIRGRKGRIDLRILTSGDYKGSLNVEAKPVFREQNIEIVLEDPKIELDLKGLETKNSDFHIAGFLLNQLSGSLTYSLKPHLNQLEKRLEETINELKIRKEIKIKSNIEQLKITRADFTEKELQMDIDLTGSLKVFINLLS